MKIWNNYASNIWRQRRCFVCLKSWLVGLFQFPTVWVFSSYLIFYYCAIDMINKRVPKRVSLFGYIEKHLFVSILAAFLLKDVVKANYFHTIYFTCFSSFYIFSCCLLEDEGDVKNKGKGRKGTSISKLSGTRVKPEH